MCGMQNPTQIEPSFALNEIVNIIYLYFIGKVIRPSLFRKQSI